MKWVKAVWIRFTNDGDPRWQSHEAWIEFRLRSDGAMYYQTVRDFDPSPLDDFLAERFADFLEEPIHSPVFTEQQFLEEVSRQGARINARPVFMKHEEELNENVKT